MTSQHLTTISDLPDDIVACIAKLLAHTDLPKVLEVSKRCHACGVRAVASLAPLHPSRLLTNAHTSRWCAIEALSLHRLQEAQHCTAAISRWIGCLPHLSSLSLRGQTGLQDNHLAQLQLPASVTSLCLSGCKKLSWSGLQCLAGLTSLLRLDVSGIKYTAGVASTAQRLQDVLRPLRSLHLGDGKTLTYVDNDLLRLIGSSCPHLTLLDCSGCIDLSDAGMEHVAQLSELTHLGLQSCVRVTQQALAPMCTVLTSLHTLDLRGCPQLVDITCISSLIHLRHLSVKGCSGLQDAGFAALHACTNLTSLDARCCDALTSLKGVARIQSLQCLHIAGCCAMAPVALAALGQLPKLQHLDASRLSLVARVVDQHAQDLALEQGLSQLTSLQVLDLSYFRESNGIPQGLLCAVSHMTALTTLKLAYACAPASQLPVQQLSAEGHVKQVPELSGMEVDTAQAIVKQPANVVAATGACRLGQCAQQLSFLSPLVQLQELDLSGWSFASPCALVQLRGMSNLTNLKLRRFANDHARQAQPVRCSKRSSQSGSCNCSLDGSSVLDDSADCTVQPRRVLTGSATCMVCTCQGSTNVMMQLDQQGTSYSAGSCCREWLASADGMSSQAANSNNSMHSLQGHLQSCEVDSYGWAEAAKGTTIADQKPVGFAVPSTLQQLRSIAGYTQCDVAMQHVGQLCSLLSLDLEACVGLSDAGLQHLATGNMARLQHLNLAGCSSLHGSALPDIAAACPLLEQISLEDSQDVAEQAVVAAVPHMTNLRTLQLAGCRNIGAAACSAIAKACLVRLHTLSLRGCHHVTTRAVVQLSSALPSLTCVNLNHCWQVEDEGLWAVGLSCPRLAELHLSYCWRVTAAAVAGLQQARPLLQVHVTHTSGCGSSSGSSSSEVSMESTEHMERGSTSSDHPCHLPPTANCGLEAQAGQEDTGSEQGCLMQPNIAASHSLHDIAVVMEPPDAALAMLSNMLAAGSPEEISEAAEQELMMLHAMCLRQL